MGFGMRAKLIILFVIIKVIPLVLITVIAIHQFFYLGTELMRNFDTMKTEVNNAFNRMSGIAIDDSIETLSEIAIDNIERTTTDLANRIAAFLYQRDNDILYAAELEPGEAAYRLFLQHRTEMLVTKGDWSLSDDGKTWIPQEPLPMGAYSLSTNSENNSNYKNRPIEQWKKEIRPLYLEMTYLDLAGNELVKITTSDIMDRQRKNVSNRLNTFVKAETYFSELAELKGGDIYVSDVIGEYVGSRLIGTYTPARAAELGIDYRPEENAYAGMENPNGRRFKGLIRWATPVVRGGRIQGYVTLALDHDHIMEFVDHITPMEERYVEIPSAAEGNYAFIWDYLCRSIAHPRHHSIVGYNSETGEPQIPWLEESIYDEWKASGQSYAEFIKNVPTFHEQSRSKKPAPELTAAGLVGLDGRYLNNAPQCTGWMDLTREGGSGSFLILWSGIWKPNTAAAIPYYTGNYGKTRRGFGMVTIGAGLEDFRRPVYETEEALQNIIDRTNQTLVAVTAETNDMVSLKLFDTTLTMGLISGLMIILVVLIAIWIASSFSDSITMLIKGISRFRAGERHFRFNVQIMDEIGTLAASFDEMADSLADADRGALIITDMDLKVLFVNDVGLALMDVKSDEILGKTYSEHSCYPENTEYDPIKALKEGTETDIFHLKEMGCYLKGEASYLTDKEENRIGYIITSMDVTELKEQQEELEKAVVEAKLANEHKGNFLARMSHEIRTPMNAIIGLTEIVKKKLSSESYNLDDVRTYITQIDSSSHYLLGLLNDILDISKIEAEKVELVPEDMYLSKIAQTVVAIIQPRCNEKNITFEKNFQLPGDKLYRGDSLRLRQALINLLGNAVKFTPEDGKVSFDIIWKERKEQKALIDFSVRDTGIGISDEAISLLFKPFQQANNQIAKKYGGTGLGLAISKSIVHLFGGDLIVSSIEGKGSEFRFSLWLEEAEAKHTEEIHFDNVTDILKGKKALLVDDIDINRIIAINLLENTGLIIDEADDGTTAVAKFNESKENEYDIIFMDIQMPQMNGYDATAAIRASARSDAAKIPIVAMTANAFKDDVDRAIASGMNAHIAKPMDMEKTIEVTLRLLSK
jgi:signal transduction histidine kinase/CheY-like chemotaxis protein/HAMP domain-containing protein